MTYKTPLELLFLTNFSDACFHATRAVAQLADDLELRLSILYAYDPKQEDRRAAQEKIDSFFPEADRFRVCNRLIAEGDVITAVSRLHSSRRIDLVVAPVSDRIGLPRLFHRSTRARLLAECGLSVFTLGRRADFRKLGSAPKNVACWLDFESPAPHNLTVAWSYAATIGARLHLLHVLPELHEGTIRAPSQPLHSREVADAVRDRTGSTALVPEIHVSPGHGPGALMQLVRRVEADLLFVSEEAALESGLFMFGSGMSSVVREAPCPTICVSDRTRALRLQPGPAHFARLPA